MEGAKFESYYLKSNYYVYQRNKDAFLSPRRDRKPTLNFSRGDKRKRVEKC